MKKPSKSCTNIGTLLEYAKEQKKVGRKKERKRILEIINKWWAKHNCHMPEELIKQIKEIN